MYRKERHRAALRHRRARQVGVEPQVGLWLDDRASIALLRTRVPLGANHLPSAEGHSGVSHKNRRFQTGFGLPLSSQKPSPNAETEQGNRDNCERQRRQPAWHVAHIEGPDDRCNHRCDCHTKKNSKGEIWLPAPGHAPQNQEQQQTGYLQQCCHDRRNLGDHYLYAKLRTRSRRAADRWAVSASCPGTDGSRYNRSRGSSRARRA